ncbi:MAG: glycosyltransferase [Candidatus Cloacimonetes bacterium]|nr:glycosyltransferase [Candidatus Cloacimonadota bacterium]
MKLVVVVPSFFPAVVYGGPIFSVLNLLKPICLLGATVLVSTTNANGDKRLKIDINEPVEMEKDLNVKYYNDTFLNVLSIPMIKSMFKDFKFADIVNVQSIFSMSTLLALLIVKLMGKKCILTPRGSLGKECLQLGRSSFKYVWVHILMKPLISNVFWHATCEQEKGEILDLFKLDESKIFILPNGINVSEYENDVTLTRDKFLQKYTKNVESCDHIIVSMGRLHEKKGLDILVKSFAKFKEEKIDAVLVIAGPDGGILEELKKISNDLGVSSSVFFPGSISGQDKVDFLACADLFVLSSHNENFGIVYAEALAAGTPIVASKKTPWKIAEDYNCGKWVENSVEETSKAMLTIFDNDLVEMGNNGKALVLEKFDWDSIAKDYYKKLKTIKGES